MSDKYVRYQQEQLRVDIYACLADTVLTKAYNQKLEAERIVILPLSLNGSCRMDGWM